MNSFNEKHYKGYKINYADSSAIIYKDEQYIKGFASDYPPNTGKSGLDKCIAYIDSIK